MSMDLKFAPEVQERASRFTIARPNLKRSRIFSFKLGKHRFAYTTDPGEVNPLSPTTFETHLGAIHRESENGPILGEYDLGAGVITGAGVLSLVNDFFFFAQEGPPAEKGKGYNTFNQLGFHNWGKGVAASKVENIKLESREVHENEEGKNVKVESTVVTSVTTLGSPVVTSKSRITAKEAGPVAITEWGIFNSAELKFLGVGANEIKEITGSAPNKTLTTTEAKFTADTEGVPKEWGKLIVSEKNEAGEAKPIWAFIRKAPTTSTLLIPESFIEETGAVGKFGLSASARGKFETIPLMFDRRQFAAINVEKGNIIEFPWELTIKGGS